MWDSRKNKKADKIDTLIGHNTEIKGDVTFSGGLHVDGKVHGSIIAEQDSGSVMSLSEQGYVEGEIRVPNIVLNGTVKGDVHSGAHIELAINARVNGNVYYALIEMARGAEVNGNLVHKPEPKASSPVKTPIGAVPAKESAQDDS
jgi:cytoskeletal protein CcmA (bactofilin family)